MANVKRKERRKMRYVMELKYRDANLLHTMLGEWGMHHSSFDSFNTDSHNKCMELANKLLKELQRELAGS